MGDAARGDVVAVGAEVDAGADVMVGVGSEPLPAQAASMGAMIAIKTILDALRIQAVALIDAMPLRYPFINDCFKADKA